MFNALGLTMSHESGRACQRQVERLDRNRAGRAELHREQAPAIVQPKE